MAKIELKQFYVPLSIVIAGALIAGAVFYAVGRPAPTTGNNTAPSALPPTPAVDIADVDTTNEPFIGNPNAPVTLAYWFDFQCPFCKRFELQTLPTLEKQYIKEGKLKVVFKDFQFLGADSQTAGLVAKAVWDLYPKSYFKWQTMMYNAQDGENSGFGDMKSILALMKKQTPEINLAKITAQIDKKRVAYQKEQDADRAEGAKFGINGTPGFIVGKQLVSGAQPASVFIPLIDAQLRAVK